MKRKVFYIIFLLLIIWISVDLLVPRKRNLRQFDPVAVGQLDAAMWRSYYEQKRVKLFFQLSKLMRQQFHAPFWRSFPMAYQAAKAATVFQGGTNRLQYVEALPYLENYFTQINRLSDRSFDVTVVAENELEWWIIRRESQYTTQDWERILAEVSKELYHLPIEKFTAYAHLRVKAMILRDEEGEAITEESWNEIRDLLEQSWTALYNAL